MSRIGKEPVPIPGNVKVTVKDSGVEVEGPKGHLRLEVPPLVEVRIDESVIRVERRSESKNAKSLHGTIRSHLANMVRGVTEGFEKILEIVGVGYRARVEGQDLVLQIGFSHPVEYTIPEGIDILVEKNTVISVRGIDKQRVGLTAAQIRGFYPPEPYKGKGIRYRGEYVRRKAGKTVA